MPDPTDSLGAVEGSALPAGPLYAEATPTGPIHAAASALDAIEVTPSGGYSDIYTDTYAA